MYRLIVHADDFGLSERVNEGILQAHRHGILTSTSLIANGPAFEQAVQICRAVPTLDVGIHLTLVEEPPLLSVAAVPSLVGAAGKLHPHARVFTKKYFRGQIQLREVRDELEAQIKMVMSHGISISHLDSHQHVHMLPDVLRITVELAKAYGIPAIRLPYEKVQLYMLEGTRAVSRICQLLVLNTFCRLGRQAIPLRTDYFHGFSSAGICIITIYNNCSATCHPQGRANSCAIPEWMISIRTMVIGGTTGRMNWPRSSTPRSPSCSGRRGFNSFPIASWA